MDYINKLLHRATSRTPSPSPLNSFAFATDTGAATDTTHSKPDHEVKVRFTREFAEASSSLPSATESLSSASSFHSLTSSSISTNHSSGICVDSIPHSLNDTITTTNLSYVDADIPGLDDLISACAKIHLDTDPLDLTQDLSQDQTFASATDEPALEDLPHDDSPEKLSSRVSNCSTDFNSKSEGSLEPSGAITPFNETVCLSNLESKGTEVLSVGNLQLEGLTPSFSDCTESLLDNVECPTLSSIPSLSESKFSSCTEQYVKDSEPEELVKAQEVPEELVKVQDVPEELVKAQDVPEELVKAQEVPEELVKAQGVPEELVKVQDVPEELVKAQEVPEELVNAQEVPEDPVQTQNQSENLLEDSVNTKQREQDPLSPVPLSDESKPKSEEELKVIQVIEEPANLTETAVITDTNEENENLDVTLTLEEPVLQLEDCVGEVVQYTEFQPQRQSTELPQPQEKVVSLSDDALRSITLSEEFIEDFANDIFKSASEEPENFLSAGSEIFQDPTSFDFLLARSTSQTVSRLRAESLYVKFDPLVSSINNSSSMLPQGAVSPSTNDEEQNGKNEASLMNTVGTPKRNPAIAAIDRLLFYSPLPSTPGAKGDEPQEKTPLKEDPKADAPLIDRLDMSKELELVRATVLQLEEQLEKQKKEHEAELDRQKVAFQEKFVKMQAQIAQEVKSKSQMTLVVEEYEKSISRLLTEKERERATYEQEKAKQQEELQAANIHLTNTEAAFNDVHQKYERLKGVVSAYKSNEAVLKESIQENMETIKGLETRYDQLKNHAMAQLEKANFELDAMRKQHEDETVKLQALVKKAELKSNSLAELVEQKTKENKELTQILDEVIARVGHPNTD